MDEFILKFFSIIFFNETNIYIYISIWDTEKSNLFFINFFFFIPTESCSTFRTKRSKKNLRVEIFRSPALSPKLGWPRSLASIYTTLRYFRRRTKIKGIKEAHSDAWTRRHRGKDQGRARTKGRSTRDPPGFLRGLMNRTILLLHEKRGLTLSKQLVRNQSLDLKEILFQRDS